MTTEELLTYLTNYVPNFLTPEVIEGPFECYHYTSNLKAIIQEGFKGAPINEDLDQTQNVGSPVVDGGVVFAYENLQDAKDEGYGCDILKILCKRAIKTLHSAEDNLGQMMSDALASQGMAFEPGENETPLTLLILTQDIISYELVP